MWRGIEGEREGERERERERERVFYNVSHVHHRIEKEFIYRKEKQSQDSAAMSVSQHVCVVQCDRSTSQLF